MVEGERRGDERALPRAAAGARRTLPGHRPDLLLMRAQMRADLVRRAFAELLGTGALVAVVVGSGIAAQRLSPDDVGLELLENAFVTGLALACLIVVLGPVSGAHLNPVITLIDRALGRIATRDALVYAAAQVAGACAGAVVANAMFDRSAVSVATHHRTSGAFWLSEAVATFGLVLLVFGLLRAGRGESAIPAAVGAYIAAAYWWSSSTSFANPAVTLGRTLSDSFAGIAPASVPMFVVMQLAGAGLALGALRILYPVQVAS